ncbi:hypothetical protein AORI_3687 [Amycolatopsis keratiniphila]|uniref:Uncharacterized protein n=1 Tax=Amycolatopsis keratiniphila TaxID=129921 RepID=R4T5H7_9PSEU|nr:hypothetical protein AORI_3687 [Amycolatopsis keratiniphila]
MQLERHGPELRLPGRAGSIGGLGVPRSGRVACFGRAGRPIGRESGPAARADRDQVSTRTSYVDQVSDLCTYIRFCAGS